MKNKTECECDVTSNTECHYTPAPPGSVLGSTIFFLKTTWSHVPNPMQNKSTCRPLFSPPPPPPSLCEVKWMVVCVCVTLTVYTVLFIDFLFSWFFLDKNKNKLSSSLCSSKLIVHTTTLGLSFLFFLFYAHHQLWNVAKLLGLPQYKYGPISSIDDNQQMKW